MIFCDWLLSLSILFSKSVLEHDPLSLAVHGALSSPYLRLQLFHFWLHSLPLSVNQSKILQTSAVWYNLIWWKCSLSRPPSAVTTCGQNSWGTEMIHMFSEAATDGSDAWVPPTHCFGMLGFCLSQPYLLQVFGEWISKWKSCLPVHSCSWLWRVPRGVGWLGTNLSVFNDT